MRLIGAAVGLSLCLACVVNRDIGAAFDDGDLTNPAANGLPSPTRFPPPPPCNDPCCLVSQQMALDASEVGVQASPPSVVRQDGGQWAVTWREWQWQDTPFDCPVIRFVEGDTPGATLRLAPATPTTIPLAMDHYLPGIAPDAGHFALVLQQTLWPRRASPDPNSYAVLVDHQGVSVAQAVIPAASQGASIVRAEGLRALAIVARDNSMGVAHAQTRLLLLDDNLAPVGKTVDLGPSLPDGWQSASVLSLDGKLVTLVVTPDGVHVRTFVGRALAEPHPEVIIEVGTTTNLRAPLGRDGRPYNAVTPVVDVTATVVWDRVIIAAMNRLTIRTWVYEPATGTLLGGPNVVGSSTQLGAVNMGGDMLGGSRGHLLLGRRPSEPGRAAARGGRSRRQAPRPTGPPGQRTDQRRRL